MVSSVEPRASCVWCFSGASLGARSEFQRLQKPFDRVQNSICVFVLIRGFSLWRIPLLFPDLGKSKDHVGAQFAIIARSVRSPPSKCGVVYPYCGSSVLIFLSGRLAVFLPTSLHR